MVTENKTEVEIQDFPYEYSHMVPFPLTNKIQKEVTAFQHFINSASDFFIMNRFCLIKKITSPANP